MRSAVRLVALLTLLAGVIAPVGAVGPVAVDSHDTTTALDEPAVVAQQSALEQTPKTDITIDLQSDRSARWRVEMRYELETENETAAFEQFAREYESGQSDIGLDEELFQRVAESAESRTSRSMAIENVTREGFVQNDTGVIRLTFRWTNFLESTNSGVRLGDAFRSETGDPWLTSLRANQNVTIRTPPGYAVNSTSLPIKNNSVVIEGPQTFESTDELTVSYRSTGGNPMEIPWGLVGVSAVALFALAAVLLIRRRPDTTRPNGPAPTDNLDDRPTERRDEPLEDHEGPADPDETEEEPEPSVDLSLLSDEERVELLLEGRGGRMKQANIVKETGWSDAKVSQLLSAMADEGRVEKLRLGRENLISLPDEGDQGE